MIFENMVYIYFSFELSHLRGLEWMRNFSLLGWCAVCWSLGYLFSLTDCANHHMIPTNLTEARQAWIKRLKDGIRHSSTRDATEPSTKGVESLEMQTAPVPQHHIKKIPKHSDEAMVALFPNIINKSKKSQSSEILTKGKCAVARAKRVNPNVNTTRCWNMFNNETYEPKCRIWPLDFPIECHPGPPNPRIAWLTSCLAQLLVEGGFQVPVYAIHSHPRNERRETRVRTQVQLASITHYREIRNPANLSEADIAHYFSLPADHSFSRKDIKATLAHYRALEMISQCKDKHKDNEGGKGDAAAQRQCLSQGADPALRFALIIEDDAFIPVTVIRQLVELILVQTTNVGLFFLDDSFHQFREYQPPGRLGHNSPYTNSWERVASRTACAYLISEATLERIFAKGGSLLPIRNPIDAHWNHVIKRDKIVTHHVIPPIICHGSALHGNSSLEGGVDRACGEWRKCCEEFYTITRGGDVEIVTPKLRAIFMTYQSSPDGVSQTEPHSLITA